MKCDKCGAGMTPMVFSWFCSKCEEKKRPRKDWDEEDTKPGVPMPIKWDAERGVYRYTGQGRYIVFSEASRQKHLKQWEDSGWVFQDRLRGSLRYLYRREGTGELAELIFVPDGF